MRARPHTQHVQGVRRVIDMRARSPTQRAQRVRRGVGMRARPPTPQVQGVQVMTMCSQVGACLPVVVSAVCFIDLQLTTVISRMACRPGLMPHKRCPLVGNSRPRANSSGVYEYGRRGRISVPPRESGTPGGKVPRGAVARPRWDQFMSNSRVRFRQACVRHARGKDTRASGMHAAMPSMDGHACSVMKV